MTTLDQIQSDKKTLRRYMRAERNALTQAQQESAASNLFALLHKHALFKNSKNIAFYLANDGEIDPLPLLLEAQACGKSCYLPVLHPFNKQRLLFGKIEDTSDLVMNSFGIWEPCIRTSKLIHPRALDVVFLPLVAFDPQGGRMGMGGGFYDYTFSFTKHSTGWQPKLVGLAHECQQVDQLKLESWDIPLSGIATDKQLYLI